MRTSRPEGGIARPPGRIATEKVFPYRDRGFISLSSGKPVVDSLGVWPSKFYSRWTVRVRASNFLRFLIAYSSRPQSRKKRLKITVFRPRRRKKRSGGRCGCRIDLSRKTPRRIGTGEVQSELHGLETTHASYVIQYLTKFIDFSADAAEENSVRSIGM